MPLSLNNESVEAAIMMIMVMMMTMNLMTCWTVTSCVGGVTTPLSPNSLQSFPHKLTLAHIDTGILYIVLYSVIVHYVLYSAIGKLTSEFTQTEVYTHTPANCTG